jgi:hypothetical protein
MATTTESLLQDARKIALLDWLCTPKPKRDPQTTVAMAEKLGVSPRTIRDWKGDPTFRALWDKQSKDVIGDPDKVAEVLEELREMALRPVEEFRSEGAKVAAAKTYLDAVDGIKPPAVDEARKRVAELSDEELRAMIAQEAQRELAGRS